MAFDANGLISFGTGGSYNPTTQRRTKLWHYISNDSLATIAASGYFNDFADKLQKGDLIFVTAAAGGTAAARMYVVAGISSGVVTVTKDDTA